MGKVELKLEIDADLARELDERGVDAAKAAEASLRDALEKARRWSLVESAREKAKDPEGAARRAREWAEENREAIEEQRAWIEKHGLLSDHELFRPRWLGAQPDE